MVIYDIIFTLFSFFYLPCLFFQGKAHKGLWQRMGFIARRDFGASPIWIHAVSVGEVGVASLLVKVLKQKSGNPLVISVVTPAGYHLAEKLIGEGAVLIYAPLDISFIVRRFLKIINPSFFILVETELWPNLIHGLHKRKIPLALVNGRISPRSFRGYSRIKFLTRGILSRINLFCMQTEEDKSKIIALGAAPQNVQVTGNMKFDNIAADADGADSGLKAALGLGADERLWVAGSTHPGEEAIILGVYKNLLADFANLRLLIAPRHIERAPEIERLIVRFGFNPLRMSGLAIHHSGHPPCGVGRTIHQIIILDTIGQLKQFYKFAAVVFVGGSLIKKGGQNILESAVFAKPIIFGPHMFNFVQISALYLSKKAAIQVKDAKGLEAALRWVLSNTRQAAAMGERAKEIIAENKGATERNADLILK